MESATSESVTIRWNGLALKSKGVDRLFFNTLSTHPQHKSTFSSIDVEKEEVTLRSLRPSVTYRVVVKEDNLDNPTLDIGIMKTLPKGKKSPHIIV